jgi:HAD superfamily hydrolase (TIGR01509 family)
MLTAVIFDFDGVIVDTEPIHYRAFQDVLQPLELGYTWDEYLERYIGFDDRDAFREVFSVAGRSLDERMLAELIDRKAAAFEAAVKLGVRPYPGVLELIRSLTGNIPLALCSGALKRDIMPILDILGIGGIFDVQVTAEDVEASKPDPESYSLAVQRLAEQFPDLAIAPGTCLAIEDTPAGIASALAAGVKVLAVANSYGAERLTEAVRVVESLEGTDLAGLRAILPETSSGRA